jgi:hypothetical protein
MSVAGDTFHFQPFTGASRQTLSVIQHQSKWQNCSVLPPASLSGEGSGEGRRS